MQIVAALFLDLLCGDPKGLPHPVVGVGWGIRLWEKYLYPKENKRRWGAVFCAAVLATAGGVVGAVLLLASLNRWLFDAVVLYLLYAALAWRSLKDESLPVALALMERDLPKARERLSHVVGRDTRDLDESAIVRATVETVGENYVDGIVSVLFFMALGWAVGGGAGAALFAWLFKAANTLDSMVGYDDERYHDFGSASARLDDVLNFIPARLGGAIALAAGACLGYPFLRACKIFLSDRRKHRSPNSAHGESAFAGLLGIRLGGGAFYEGAFEERPFIGDSPDARDAEPADIFRAHRLLDASVALCALLVMLAIRQGKFFPLL